MRRLSAADPRRAAFTLTTKFLRRLPAVRELLQTDVDAAFEGDPAARSREEIITAYPFIEAIAVQRLAHELQEAGVIVRMPMAHNVLAYGLTGRGRALEPAIDALIAWADDRG